MYKNEILKKFDIKDSVFPFTLTMLARDRLVISGVKRALLLSDEKLRFQLHGCILQVEGKALKIIEMGGGDVYVKGEIGGLSFER